MLGNLNITLAQLNPTVGDVAGNAAKILESWRGCDSDLIVFSELVLSGYPPEDLVLKPSFIKALQDKVESICQESKDFSAAALISSPWMIDGALYNAALFIESGEIKAISSKHHLPNYGVFDEKRVFSAGPLPDPISFRSHKLGVLSCEDGWQSDVCAHLKAQGAEIFISLNGSPFEIGKIERRTELAAARARETGLPFLYVNQVGGQDELVFDGTSFVMDAGGRIVQTLKRFEEDVQPVGVASAALPRKEDAIYDALVLGLGDYVRKNGFPGILLGLSGGIDSALAAVIAVDAIGAENIHCVMMPSRYTSEDSLEDAAALARNLGVKLDTIPIESPVAALNNLMPADAPGVTLENIQSRTRGLILMGLSNSSGKMVVSTGNKSEMAVGYATLYGDMCGGFNALKDLYKGQVYALSRWINREREIIPERIITKAPTAELRDNQTDQDSLPDYDVLDGILECLIEHEMSLEDIAARGYDMDTAMRVWHMLERAEYKRRQAPPGVKITPRAFGRDRRYPITNGFKG